MRIRTSTPVVVETFDECLGLKERVARDGEHPVRVDRHAARQLGPAVDRLGAKRYLQEPLEQPAVLDSRADPLVVLRVTDDEPRPTRSSFGATTAKSGLTSVASVPSKPANGTASPWIKRRSATLSARV